MIRQLLTTWSALVLATVTGVSAQQASSRSPFRLFQADGAVVQGALRDWTADGVQLAGKQVATSQVLFFHGPATRLESTGRVKIRLVGVEPGSGDEICGDVVGGDEDGEHVTVRTSALGNVDVQLDDVALLRVRQNRRFHAPERFVTGGPDKEAVFRETPLGLDPVVGVLASIQPKGVRFEWREGAEPELFTWGKIAGLRLAAADPEVTKAPPVRVVLLCSDGSRVTGVPRHVDATRLQLETRRLGTLTVELSRVLAGHVLAPNRAFVSSLQPVAVDERDLLSKQALYPYQRDRNVFGTPLSVRRRYWTTGIGVHSLSRLSYKVPAGVKTFRVWVGADDTAVTEYGVGDMDFVVRVGDKVAAVARHVRGGQALKSLAPVAVQPGATLTLELGFGAQIHTLDRGDWLAPVFLK